MNSTDVSTLTIGGDLTVGRIGFGAMQLSGKQVWGEYPITMAASLCCVRSSTLV